MIHGIRFLCLITAFVFVQLADAHSSYDYDKVAKQIAEEYQDKLAEGVQAYRQHNYPEAISILRSIDHPVASLFLAKSYFGNGEYSEAIQIATPLSQRPPLVIANEAQYLRALSHYQLREYQQSLELLYFLNDEAIDRNLARKAFDYYKSIVRYLSSEQRLQVIQRTRNTAVIKDLIHPENLTRLSDTQLQQLQQASGRALSDRSMVIEPPVSDNLAIPTGTVYRIGILLPGFEENDEDRMVSRGLYGGLLMAADQFNRNNSDRKLRLIFQDTEQNGSNLGSSLTELLDKNRVDLIIGPLFSEQVSQLSSVANRRGIPMFAPLANTINIAANNEFVFQMNPSFEARGRQYAQFLVQNRGKKRIGVITESGTLGEDEARAFRDEAIRLGAEVPLFFSEDFARTGYSVAHVLPWFANDQALIQDTIKFRADSLDAVFLSFTSDVAETLLDLTLTGLEAFRPDYTILTNETLSYIDHSLQRIRRLNLIYADTYYLSEQSEQVTNFRFDYINRTGFEPSRFSYIGYDLGLYLNQLLDIAGNPGNINQYVADQEEFEGIATRIFFGESRMNESLQFFRLTTQGVERVSRLELVETFSPLEEEEF